MDVVLDLDVTSNIIGMIGNAIVGLTIVCLGVADWGIPSMLGSGLHLA